MACTAQGLLQQQLQRHLSQPSLHEELAGPASCTAISSVGALVVLLQLAAFLWAIWGLAATPTSSKAGRNAHLDNAKFLAMVLVCLHHVRKDDAHFPVADVALFHMVLFTFLSGTFARPYSPQVFLKTMINLGCPLLGYIVVIHPLVSLWEQVVHTGGDFHLGAWTPYLLDAPYFETSFWALFFGSGPGYYIWFLRCLLLWRSVSMFTCTRPRTQFFLALCGGCLATYLPPADAVSVFARFLTMFPFFVMGQQLDLERILHVVPAPSTRTCLCTWAVVMSLIFLMQQKELWKMVTFGVFEKFILNHANLDGAFPYQANCPKDFFFEWTRYLLSTAYRAGLMLAFLLFGVPRHQTWYTDAGSRTLYSYLLHPVATALAKEFLQRLANTYDLSPLKWSWSAQYASYMAVVAFLTVYFALAVYALTTRPFRFLFGPFLEPGWLLPRDHARGKASVNSG